MSSFDLQPHRATAAVLADLAVYTPPGRRAENSALATELSARETLTDAERRVLFAAVVAYALSLPLGLLDEQQSAAFAEALHWAWMNGEGEVEESLEEIRSAARSLQYEPLRQQTLARLVEPDAAEDHSGTGPCDLMPGSALPGTATTTPEIAVTPEVAVVPDSAPPEIRSPVLDAAAEDAPTDSEAGSVPDDRDDVPPPVLPRRDQVESVRVLVARSVLSIVSFALPEKREENSQFLTEVIRAEPPVEAEEWGRLAFIIGVYARNFPVPSLSRVQLRRLWDASRWAVWYEYWFRERNLASRINQLVSLLQRLPPGDSTELVEQTAPELRMIVTIAKPKALQDITEFLESAVPEGPQTRRLVAEAREQHALRGESPEAPASEEHSTTPVPPALVPVRVRDLLKLRLTRADAATAIEQVWEYLDPQFDEANRNRLRRGRQGEARPLTDLITHACQGAERRLRHRRSTVSETDVRTLCGLALFAVGYNGDVTPGLLRMMNLYGLYLLRADAVGVEGYAQLVEAVGQEHPEARAQIVGQALDEGIRQLDDLQSGIGTELLEGWVGAAVAWSKEADRTSLAQFVAAAERCGIEESVDLLLLRKAATAQDASDNALPFLSEADRAAFDEHYRRARVYEIADLLAKHEAGILETLSRSLAAPSFSEYRPPAKTVKVIIQGGQNRFSELRRKTLSGDVAQAREARDSFARASAGRRDWERRTLREWRVYAAMQVDLFDAIPEWLEAVNSNSASLEEKWNLSVFHAGQRDYATALTFLQPSVQTARSSYDYLLFACYLAIQVILNDATSADADKAREFLVGNLRAVLAPEAHLLWIVLANKHRDGTDVMQFSDAIRAHRTLWDSPIGFRRRPYSVIPRTSPSVPRGWNRFGKG